MDRNVTDRWEVYRVDDGALWDNLETFDGGVLAKPGYYRDKIDARKTKGMLKNYFSGVES